MSTTPTGFVCFGVNVSDDEGDCLGTLTKDVLQSCENSRDDIEFALHGCDEFLGRVAHVPGTLVSVDWGGSKSIAEVIGQEITSERLGPLAEFCAHYGIQTEPAWVVGVLYF